MARIPAIRRSTARAGHFFDLPHFNIIKDDPTKKKPKVIPQLYCPGADFSWSDRGIVRPFMPENNGLTN